MMHCCILSPPPTSLFLSPFLSPFLSLRLSLSLPFLFLFSLPLASPWRTHAPTPARTLSLSHTHTHAGGSEKGRADRGGAGLLQFALQQIACQVQHLRRVRHVAQPSVAAPSVAAPFRLAILPSPCTCRNKRSTIHRNTRSTLGTQTECQTRNSKPKRALDTKPETRNARPQTACLDILLTRKSHYGEQARCCTTTRTSLTCFRRCGKRATTPTSSSSAKT